MKKVPIKKSFLVVLMAGLMWQCFSNRRPIPGEINSDRGTGYITGRVVTVERTPLEGVTVHAIHMGTTYTTTTDSLGRYQIIVDKAARKDGVQLNYHKHEFARRSRAKVFELANLRIDVEDVVLPIRGRSEKGELVIVQGFLLDDFSYEGLEGANLVLFDSLNQAVVGQSDRNGKFVLKSPYLALESSYLISAYKEHYTSRHDILVEITSLENEVVNSPVRLYRKFGSVTGCILDGNTGTNCNPADPQFGGLGGVTVTVIDSNYDTITKTTGADGRFTITPADTVFLHTGREYELTLAKTDYFSQTVRVRITSTGMNSIYGDPVRLMPNVRIVGDVTEETGCTPPGVPQVGDEQPVDGVFVELSTNASFTNIIATTTTGTNCLGMAQAGRFCFVNNKISKGTTYHLRLTKPLYVSQVFTITPMVNGDNMVSPNPRELCTLPAPNYFLTGKVYDYFSHQELNGVVVTLKRGMTVTTDFTSNKAQIGGFLDSQIPYGPGTFRVAIPSIPAAPTNGDTFTLEISRPPDYTGRDDIDKHTFVVTYNSAHVYSHGGNHYMNADITYGGCTVPANYERDLCQMHPLGIHFHAGGLRQYMRDVRQTYEPFLTGKIGLTLMARERSLISGLFQSNMAIKKQDSSAFYIHLDDNWNNYPAVLPADSKIAHTVSINGYSPMGYIMNGIANDTRAIPYNVKPFTMWQFLVTTPGSFTIETTGSTDTFMTLYNYNRVELASDDNSGGGGNARIVRNLLKGWYFVAVRGSTPNVFGFYNIQVTGPEQTGPVIPGVPMTSYLNQNQGVVLSFYNREAFSGGGGGPGYNGAANNNNRPAIYVAEKGEAGSEAFLRILKYEKPGGFIRGQFYGKLRLIQGGAPQYIIVSSAHDPGYFNVIRTE
ncbi:MAG: hypothetical protein NZM25_00800 [Leptospiraceae bacterium]|nr:hypothetical protein [Leptospiraceae bacterium]